MCRASSRSCSSIRCLRFATCCVTPPRSSIQPPLCRSRVQTEHLLQRRRAAAGGFRSRRYRSPRGAPRSPLAPRRESPAASAPRIAPRAPAGAPPPAGARRRASPRLRSEPRSRTRGPRSPGSRPGSARGVALPRASRGTSDAGTPCPPGRQPPGSSCMAPRIGDGSVRVLCELRKLRHDDFPEKMGRKAPGVGVGRVPPTPLRSPDGPPPL